MTTRDINKLDGFRVGNYFVSFPPGDFIKEDDNGNMYAEVEIYNMHKNGQAEKLSKDKIDPEVDRIISDELNKLIQEALQMEKGRLNEQD